MNKDGTPENLIPAHPGNTNAVRHGVYSTRVIHARASAIELDLFQAFDFDPVERIAIEEVTRLKALAESIDRHLEEHGPVDKRETRAI